MLTAHSMTNPNSVTNLEKKQFNFENQKRSESAVLERKDSGDVDLATIEMMVNY